MLSDDPHFPTVHELIEQGDLYLVMDHIEGPTLARLVGERTKRGDTPVLAEIVRMGRGIAHALEKMHSKGLVYRDLNPENVIVVANGEPRLLDLELVSLVGSTSALFAAGSPGYASPQQLEGFPAAVADDVYALGALLSFAATGREPSAGLRLDGVDEGLSAVIERCCALDPSERWPSMTDVNAALSGISTATT
jgi:serine/threonine protein kinase